MFKSKVLADPNSALFQNFDNPILETPSVISSQLVLLQFRHWNFTGEIQTGEMIAHVFAAPDILQFMETAFKIRFPIHSSRPVAEFDFSDEMSCEANNSSCHNMRQIDDGTGRWSLHAIGFAFDINPKQNPCIMFNQDMEEIKRLPPFGEHRSSKIGTLANDHELVQLMIGLGWDWGGNWTTPKDYQHFQKKRELLPPTMQPFVC